jgi:hypothetical protein
MLKPYNTTHYRKMSTIYDRVLELYYVKPLTVHEQRIECFTKLKELQEHLEKTQPDTAYIAAYKKEYERCEPIMRMK